MNAILLAVAEALSPRDQLTVRILVAFAFVLVAMALCAVVALGIVGSCIRKGVKLETIVVIAKAYCFVVIGFFTPFTVGLTQWANSGEMPGPIIWIVTSASCVCGAAAQLLSFLSGSYSDYVAGRKHSASFETTSLTKLQAEAQAQAKNQP